MKRKKITLPEYTPYLVMNINNKLCTLTEEFPMRMFQNRLLRKIFWLKKDEVTAGCHNHYYYYYYVFNMKSYLPPLLYLKKL